MGVIINMFEEGTIVTVIFFLIILFAMLLLCFLNFVDKTFFLSKDSEKTKNKFSINIKKNKNKNLVIISKIKNARNVEYDIFSFRKPIVEKSINNIFKKGIFHINENIEKISKININDFIKNKD